ncbi:PAS domain S-box protein [Candidatus Dependentiae bacterium]|nr:PAS domain S-box protein [Candidatus Dependentiae bacterium]
MEISVNYISEPKGRLIVFVRDITERKMFENDLLKERFRLSEIIRGTNVGTWEWNIQTGETIFNEQWAEIIGYKLDELMPVSIKTWIDFAHPEDLKKSGELLEKHFKGELEYYEIESRMKHKNGSWVWVLDRGKISKWTEDRKPLLMFGTHQNITDRKYAEEALKQSEKKFRTFFENNPALIKISKLPERIITEVNNAFLNKTGYTKSEIIGKRSEDVNLFVYTDADKKIFIDNNLKEKGKIDNIELIIQAKNANMLEVIFFGEIIESQGDKYLMTVMSDITEQKKAERAAIAADNAKSDFLANISHEIRTPLNAIVSMSHFLEKTGLTPEQSEYIGVLNTASENLLFLIEQILDISKLEKIYMKLDNEIFDIKNIVQNIISIIKPKLKEKPLNFNFNMDNDIPAFVTGDPFRIKQILLNLLSNAIKFTESGKIDFDIKLLNESSDSCELLFSVADTGIGMTDFQKNIIFNKFTQADSSISKKYGGTGLGLYIAKELVKLMGGKIQIEDNNPHGSIFKFNIKLGVSKKEKFRNRYLKQKLNYETLLAQKNYSILAAEDDKTNQFILKNLFKNYKNISLSIASNGIEAVNLFKNNNFDLVLMDINMPKMDGFTAAREIRKIEKNYGTATIPIMLFTATTIEKLNDNIKDLEIYGYILKPIEPSDFYVKISEVLNFSTESVYKPQKKSSDISKLKIICGKIIDVEKALNNIDWEFELYLKLINLYINEYTSQSDIIKKMFKEKVSDKIIFISHKLITASANIGAYNLSALSKQIQDTLNDKKNVGTDLYNLFINEFEDVNKCVVQIKNI